MKYLIVLLVIISNGCVMSLMAGKKEPRAKRERKCTNEVSVSSNGIIRTIKQYEKHQHIKCPICERELKSKVMDRLSASFKNHMMGHIMAEDSSIQRAIDESVNVTHSHSLGLAVPICIFPECKNSLNPQSRSDAQGALKNHCAVVHFQEKMAEICKMPIKDYIDLSHYEND